MCKVLGLEKKRERAFGEVKCPFPVIDDVKLLLSFS